MAVGVKLQGILCQYLLALCLLVQVPAGHSAETVQALRYGVSLYHYFQQDYFEALSELMTAQQLEQLGPHTHSAELLRGGMSLSYGLDREAERIFTALIEEPGSSPNRDQAWFYLGKVAWQRGQADRAAHFLARMRPGYAGPLEDEANYLRAQINLRVGNEAMAREFSQRIDEGSTWRYYHSYNQGAVRAAAGEWQGALSSFAGFEDFSLSSKEDWALSDKAFTAAGYAHMATGQFDLARQSFHRVRLYGTESGRALLGYGWAASELGDFKAALSPWTELSRRPPLENSVRESLLAIPYAYENLGRASVALAGYQQAAAVYEGEIQGLQNAIGQFQQSDLRALLDMAEQTNLDWRYTQEFLPQDDVAPYLKHLYTRHRFQLAVRDLRDLYSASAHMARAEQRLQVLAEVDAHQQEIWSGIARNNRRETLLQRQQDLAQRIGHLQQQLAAAMSGHDPRLLADAVQLQRWQRLHRAERGARIVDAHPAQREQLRLLRGLLMWEDNEQFPARKWSLQRQLGELELLAEESRIALARVDDALGGYQQGSAATRITGLAQRVQIQRRELAVVLEHAEDRIRQVAIAELELQSAALRRDLGRSRLAIARLYDMSSTGMLP